MVYIRGYGDIDPMDLAKEMKINSALTQEVRLSDMTNLFREETEEQKKRKPIRIKPVRHNAFEEMLARSRKLNKGDI